jgi:hypothetical protein
MALTAEGRATFIDSCVEMVLAHNFDGLDLDWEYPGGREDSPGTNKRIDSQDFFIFENAFESFECETRTPEFLSLPLNLQIALHSLLKV